MLYYFSLHFQILKRHRKKDNALVSKYTHVIFSYRLLVLYIKADSFADISLIRRELDDYVTARTTTTKLLFILGGSLIRFSGRLWIDAKLGYDVAIFLLERYFFLPVCTHFVFITLTFILRRSRSKVNHCFSSRIFRIVWYSGDIPCGCIVNSHYIVKCSLIDSNEHTQVVTHPNYHSLIQMTHQNRQVAKLQRIWIVTLYQLAAKSPHITLPRIEIVINPIYNAFESRVHVSPLAESAWTQFATRPNRYILESSRIPLSSDTTPHKTN